MNTNPIRRAAVAAVVATASAASALSAQAATPTGKIVFSRSTQTPTSTPRSRSLWLLDVGTGQVRALTTATDSVYDMSVTWSPDGNNLVFERGVDRVREGQRHTLQVLSTTTNTRPHALIHGVGQFSKPAYGPGNRIAFVSLNSSGAVRVRSSISPGAIAAICSAFRRRRNSRSPSGRRMARACSSAPVMRKAAWNRCGTRRRIASTWPPARRSCSATW